MKTFLHHNDAREPWQQEIADVIEYVDAHVVMQELVDIQQIDNQLIYILGTQSSVMERVHGIRIYYTNQLSRTIDIRMQENRKTTGQSEITIKSNCEPSYMARIFKKMYISTHRHIGGNGNWEYTITFTSISQLGKLINMFEKGEI